MNNEQINLIRRSFEKLSAKALAESFYNRLFSIQPALRLLFPDDLGNQKEKLMQMLEAAIELLDAPEKLVPVLEESGRRHALYGVREEHYETLRTALLASLREMNGTSFTAETEAAWTKLYNIMSETMKRGARRLTEAPEQNQEKNTEEKSMKIFKQAKFITGFIFLIFIFSAAAFAQTTAFTYQGKLNDGAMPANGSYLLEFKLFDTPAVGTGAQIGTTLSDVPAAVANGVFTVQLDFGANAFTGADRFLEISVRRNAGESYTTLAPRQAVSSTPYAIKSKSAETAVTSENSNQLGGIGASQFVRTTDSRLTDARLPLAGSENYIQNSTTEQSSSNFYISGEGRASRFSANAFYLGNERALGARFSNLYVGSGTGANLLLDAEGNTFIGNSAGRFTNSGDDNTFVGYRTGENNTVGVANSFFGNGAGVANNTASGNSFFGYGAGGSNIVGNFSSFFGLSAGAQSTGGNNAFFGAATGSANITGTNNTMIGTFADVIGDNLNFATAIGANSRVSTSNTIALGRPNGSDTVLAYGRLQINTLGAAGATTLCRNASNQISTCSSSLRYKTNINAFNSGLSIINRLRPITFDWKDGGMRDLGLGAEDVAAVDENLVIRNEKGEVEGVKYDRLGVVLINAVKEQQMQIAAQQKMLEEQARQIELLKQIVCSQNPNTGICKGEK